MIKFRTAVDRSTLMSIRGVLKGTKICLDDDLTTMQQEHKKASMTKVMEARNAGKWAVYRVGKVVIPLGGDFQHCFMAVSVFDVICGHASAARILGLISFLLYGVNGRDVW